MAVRTALAPVSAEVSDQKVPKPEARNAVLIDPDLVNPAMAQKVLRFGANNLMASRAVARAAKEAHCSKTLIAPIMKQLVSLGAVTLIQAGKAGRNSGRAAIYRREL